MSLDMGVLKNTRNGVRDTWKRVSPKTFARTRTLRYFTTFPVAADRGAGAELGRRLHWKVGGGPFEGLKYPWWLAGNTLLGPKLLGCFERELHPVVERIIDGKYKTVVNIGSAEGYYTVGLALRMPGTQILAYEADPVMRMLCHDLAELNGVADRIRMKEWCGPEELRTESLADTFVICDVEGYETTLLDPVAVPGLKQCDFLVETHDGRDETITPTLLERFAPTHTANQILVGDRDDAKRAAPLADMSDERRTLATGEFRRHSRGWIEFRRK